MITGTERSGRLRHHGTFRCFHQPLSRLLSPPSQPLSLWPPYSSTALRSGNHRWRHCAEASPGPAAPPFITCGTACTDLSCRAHTTPTNTA